MQDERMNYVDNRELSWLKFNERVLDEAVCESTPLWERLKFVAIFGTNLDEFYRVRVGTLVDSLLISPDFRENKTSMTAAQQLEKIYERTAKLCRKRDRIYEDLKAQLSFRGIACLKPSELTSEGKKKLDVYFERYIKKLVMPQVVQEGQPFPAIDNKQMVLAVSIQSKLPAIGIAGLPDAQRIWFPYEDSLSFVLLEDILAEYAKEIFYPYKITEKTIISITRNADIDTDAGLVDEDVDFRAHMKKILKKRAHLAPVRLETALKLSDDFRRRLQKRFELKKEQIFITAAPMRMEYVFSLPEKFDDAQRQELLEVPFEPAQAVCVDSDIPLMKQVMRKDVLLSYPYESMEPFLRLIKEAVQDKNVEAIYITLYRVSKRSKLVEYLIRGAEAGKKIVVLMELRARFDEQNNIDWAERLIQAGAKVIYGFEGYKVHSKICLIEKRDKKGVGYIAQIGTGNYNEQTAKLYTDLSLITADRAVCDDAARFFENMQAGNLLGIYDVLWVAPVGLKQKILSAIDEQIEKAKAGEPALVIMKLNSLTDRMVIDKLAEASRAGVRVKLIVRGICCLIPGVAGETENITVVSIIGRFLEHSRIYVFGSGEDARVLISSADMMTRNTERRVEIACPVQDKQIKDRLLQMIAVQERDNVKARDMDSNAKYHLRSGLPTPFCAQDHFIGEAAEAEMRKSATRRNENIFSRILRFFKKKG